MSLNMPETAAYALKDNTGFDKSHIIFENYNMGLMLSFIQECGFGDITLEFKNSFPVTHCDTKIIEPFSFNFISDFKNIGKFTSAIETHVQGYLLKKAGTFSSFFGSSWDKNFYVLTNVGFICFEDKNYSEKTRYVKLVKLTIQEHKNQKIDGQNYVFTLNIDGTDE
eukprot:CAMPEP_0176356632 /NCGR_PEP_ID=MMETSP0126-20121128/14155_1 /TAXON_ID=141414 ORGANISM="Strombidinopsis acuminatum, Strain SPMC142" /NCGR_SAMPLE_ID=MMETSP0126 /ASSEMBLY_ACC=CAM_ASM_000229 /LENGTH=166 /DNA_ID=CAMNT_0017709809 /DNA_START=569 /DNA_END=1069 /DNA_ORIENTATION=+